MASCESTDRELSFEWSHHRISSIDSKVRVTLQNSIKHSGSERVKSPSRGKSRQEQHHPKTYGCQVGAAQLGYLSFTWENRKFRVENQMVCAIQCRKLWKIWALIWGDAIFQLILVCSADLDILCSGSFFHQVKFYSLMFISSTQRQFSEWYLFGRRSRVDI